MSQKNEKEMLVKRKLKTVYAPPSQPGFLGKGHIAKPVIQVNFAESDPFIMLMDDILDKKDDVPVGGPHPHAGFETVSLLLEGEMGEEPHLMKAGDFEMMTAGSGVVHTETISQPTKMRLLQLWLNLPKNDRHAPPRIQKLSSERIPVNFALGVRTKVYSGTIAGITSPIKNYTPLIIAELNMEPHSSAVQYIPAHFNTFLYVVEGNVLVGDDRAVLSRDHVGWLDIQEEQGSSELLLKAGDEGARLVLYSALPQNHEIVSHGPFIADSLGEIRQLYADYQHGKMAHISDYTEST